MSSVETATVPQGGGRGGARGVTGERHQDRLGAVAASLDVRLVAGSLPPDLCGVGDYTAVLAEELRRLGARVELVLQDRRDRVGAVVAAQPRDAIVHLQYPTAGVGASFGPLFGCLRRPGTVLTLHEFSHVHPLRRMMGTALAAAAGQVVVTNEFERGRLRRRLSPLRARPPAVLPIPANIPVGRTAEPQLLGDGDGDGGGRPYTIGFFGIIRPGMAIEHFLQLAEVALHAGAPVRFEVIGGWHEKDRDAVAALRERTARWPMRWTGWLDDEQASVAIAGLDVAYLPYRDGISERRASALAMLAHGVPVVTTKGRSTTPELAACVLFARNPSAAWQAMGGLDRGRLALLGAAAERVVERRSAARVAEQHVALYQAVRLRLARR